MQVQWWCSATSLHSETSSDVADAVLASSQKADEFARMSEFPNCGIRTFEFQQVIYFGFWTFVEPTISRIIVGAIQRFGRAEESFSSIPKSQLRQNNNWSNYEVAWQ